MVSYRRQIIFLIISVLICAVLIFSIYTEVKKSAIQAMNERQMIYARLAARGVETVIDHQLETLHILAGNAHIIQMDNKVDKLLQSQRWKISTKYIKNVIRLDAQGKIIYTMPSLPNLTGKNISAQSHVRGILRTHKPVVSDIFMTDQGFHAFTIHVPVYRDKTFDGTIAFLISISELTKDYLDNLYIKNSRYAQLINSRGKIMSGFPRDHSGRYAPELYKESPALVAMIHKMMKGEEGIATYIEQTTEGDMAAGRKHAVYTPVRIMDSFWSIALISSERLMLPSIKSLRIRIILLAASLLLVFAIIGYIAARVRSAGVEAQKSRQIEEDLIKSAREVQDLYNNAPCGYHSLDTNDNIVRINNTELSWLGYTRKELIGNSYMRVLPEASRDRFAGAFTRLKAEGLVRDVEYEMARKDGSTFPVLVTASAMTDAEGKFVMSRSMVTDMTVRRTQEERLRDSEELYRTALESTSDGVTIVQKGKYVYVSQRLLDTIGQPDLNLVGTMQGSYVHPDDWAKLTEAYQYRRKDDSIPTGHELRVAKPDGSIVYLHVTAVIVKYHGSPAILSFIRDITMQKETENALRASEELYRTALESTSDGITIADVQEGKYLYVNQKLMATLGRQGENIIGQPVDIFVHPEDVGLGKKYLLERKKSGKTVSYFESRILKPDGSIALFSVTALAIIFQGRKAVLSFCQDITEKKRKEQALRESEALYRTAMESTSDGVSILQDGQYVYVNQKFLDTLGVTRDAIINRPLGILAGPEAREGLKKFLVRHPQDTPLPDLHTTRVLKSDGTSIYLQSSSVDIIYQGKPSILTFIQDITERKKAEQTLRESEELYRTAMEETNDGISIVQEGTYVYANQKLLETIGREEAEIINQPLGIYMPPDDLAAVRKYFVARIQGEDAPVSCDIRVMKPDGSYVTLNIKAVKITYQGKPATISFITDVTEQRRAEETLRQSEERYRTIIESIDDDYFETDLNGNITFFNKPVTCSGLSREEFMGTKHTQYMKPEMAEKLYQTFKQVYLSGTPIRMMNYEVIRTDGNITHQEMSVSLIRNAAGEPAGFRGISRNVSERFKMEEERNKLTEQLHQAQKMEAIGTLAGGIAHDFNNLLMGIQGYTSLMMLAVDATHPSYEQLKAVQSLVQSGASLTRQLLGFARAGRYEVVLTDLNDLVGKSITLFSRTRKEISIFEKYAEKIWTVEADRGQIEQVLLNMFVNAWQAMPGGGSLYLETKNVVLDDALANLHDLPPGHYVKISITDTGVGMDKKTRQRIFDPFFTTKEMGRGTGLGLASAYGIIKGHSGMITVYSEKGQGTTFNIYLPASLKEINAEESVESELVGGWETILLVDDEEVITDVTGKLLTELGYKIITAGSGDEATAIYAQRHADIDLVILDMIMPGISGSDTFDRLKAINPSVRAILSSGYSMSGKAQSIMDRGVRVFLQKPYRFNDLAQKIREALSD